MSGEQIGRKQGQEEMVRKDSGHTEDSGFDSSWAQFKPRWK